MPKIPTYQPGGVSLRPLPTPQAAQNLPAAAFDGGGTAWQQIGQDLKSVANDWEKRAEEMKKEDDANAVMAAYTEASDLARQWTMTTQEARLGQNALGRKQIGGASAYERDVYEDATITYDEISKKVAEKLANDDQRNAFMAMWSREREMGLDKAASFMATQRKAWQDGQTEAMLTNAVNNAADNAGNEKAIEENLLLGKKVLWANRRGKSSQEMQALEDNFTSTVHGAVLNNLAKTDVGAAKGYYAKYGKQLDAKADEQVKGLIEREEVVQLSMDNALRILGKGLSDKEMKAEVDRLYPTNGAMRDAVWTRIRQEQAFRKQGQEESKRARLGTLLRDIYTEADPQKRMDMVLRSNPEDFSQALNFVEALNKPAPESPEDKENSRRLDSVINAQLRREVDLGTFKSEHEILSRASQLGVKDITNANDAVNYWRGGGGGLKDSEVRTMFKEMTGKDAAKDEKKFAAVYDYINTLAPKAEGRQVPPETVRKLMGEALLNYDPGLFSSERNNAEWLAQNKKALSEFKGADLYEFRPDIPPETQAGIASYLRANKKDASPDSIRKYYIHKYMGIPIQKQGGK